MSFFLLCFGTNTNIWEKISYHMCRKNVLLKDSLFLRKHHLLADKIDNAISMNFFVLTYFATTYLFAAHLYVLLKPAVLKFRENFYIWKQC